jgi:hypothetical protein
VKKNLIIVGVIMFGGYGLTYFAEDHQRYLEFERQRNVWHQNCDAYIDKPVTTPKAVDCQQKLAELTAYAKRQGWN